MHDSQSILRTIIEGARSYLDEPEQSGKYSDDYLLRHAVAPAVNDVYGRLANFSEGRAVMSYTLELVDGRDEYELPPAVREIWLIAHVNDDGDFVREIVPRGQYNPRGFGWRVEGSTLKFDQTPKQGSWVVFYSPDGSASPHVGTGTIIDETSFTLDAEPEIGNLDRRRNAYGGCMLRLIPESGPIDERIIRNYDSGTRVATFGIPTELTGDVDYEVITEGTTVVASVVAAKAAMKIAVWRNASQVTTDRLALEYRTQMKTLGDRAADLQARVGRFFDRNTIDARRENRPQGTWIL